MSPYPSLNVFCSYTRLVFIAACLPSQSCPTMHCAPPNSPMFCFLFFFYCCHLATYFRMYSSVTSLLLQENPVCSSPAPNYMCVQKKKKNGVRLPAFRGIIVAAMSLLCCVSHYERQSITLQAICSGSWRCGARNGRLTVE